MVGKADVEFYYGALVLLVAKAMPGKPYDTLGYRARQRRLDAAVNIAQAILNSDDEYLLYRRATCRRPQREQRA